MGDAHHGDRKKIGDRPGFQFGSRRPTGSRGGHVAQVWPIRGSHGPPSHRYWLAGGRVAWTWSSDIFWNRVDLRARLELPVVLRAPGGGIETETRRTQRCSERPDVTICGRRAGDALSFHLELHFAANNLSVALTLFGVSFLPLSVTPPPVAPRPAVSPMLLFQVGLLESPSGF